MISYLGGEVQELAMLLKLGMHYSHFVYIWKFHNESLPYCTSVCFTQRNYVDAMRLAYWNAMKI